MYDCSSIDEIVLNYVVSILEELGEENSGEVEDAFDAEGFCEMMAAYVPEFDAIRLPQVCLWMFELEASLRKVKEEGQLNVGCSVCTFCSLTKKPWKGLSSKRLFELHRVQNMSYIILTNPISSVLYPNRSYIIGLGSIFGEIFLCAIE